MLRACLQALSFALVCGTAQAQDAAALRARHAALQKPLADNAFGRPLHVASSTAGGAHNGEIDAVLEQPFGTVAGALARPGDWCEILTLLERACERTGLSVETFLFDFGVFTAATTFARLYSVLFKLSPTARDFLLTVETPIHDTVRVAMPDARPPELKVTDLGENGLQIVYSSPRRICAMLRGLVEGTGRVYEEALHVEEPECMHRGDPACRVVVLFP